MRIPALIVAASLVSSSAIAQYGTGFEDLSGSAAGTVLTGQDGYYLPAGTNSVDFNVHTYAGNPLGIPQNPNGGDQFIAGIGPGSPTFARAQRDMTWGAGTGTWVCGFDVLATYAGTLPSAQNLGSFSVQPFPGSQSFIALARWTDPATATNWNADYVWFDAAGTQLTESVADPGFQNLAVDTWYRWETVISLDTNQILEVRITDLASGTTVSNNPVDRYMEGGTAGSATPTGFRFFAGGGVPGNALAFDNASIDELCADLTVTGDGMPGTTLTFDLTGAQPRAWAFVVIGGRAGSTTLSFGPIGTLQLGVRFPFVPLPLGFTDANGDASRDLRLPNRSLQAMDLYAQGLSVGLSRGMGLPSLEFCTSDVEMFQIGTP